VAERRRDPSAKLVVPVAERHYEAQPEHHHSQSPPDRVGDVPDARPCQACRSALAERVCRTFSLSPFTRHVVQRAITEAASRIDDDEGALRAPRCRSRGQPASG